MAVRFRVIALTSVMAASSVVGLASSAAATTSAPARVAGPTTIARATTATAPLGIVKVALASAPMAIVADDTHSQVFLATNTGVIVVGYDGTIRTTIPTGYSYSLAMNSDDSVLYVSTPGVASLSAVDPVTYATTVLPTPGMRPQHLVYTGGKVWFGTLAAGSHGLASYDPATGVVSDLSTVMYGTASMAALPDRPDRLMSYIQGGGWETIDVSGTTPSVVASAPNTTTRPYCYHFAVLPGGDKFVRACDGDSPILQVHDTATLAQDSHVATNDQWSGDVAVNSSGTFVASSGQSQSLVRDVEVTDISQGLPGTVVRSLTGLTVMSNWATGVNGLAFGSGGQLFVAGGFSAGELDIVPDATKPMPDLKVIAPVRIDFRGDAHLTGTLGYAPAGSDSVHLTRTDAGGTADLGVVPVAADGSFTYTDGGTKPIGWATYRVDFGGDSTHASATNSTTVLRSAAPYDFNGDGYADLVVGAPKEDVGSLKDAGEVHVLYGNASGVSGAGSLGITQDTTGVPGGSEAGDMFGAAQASGDFNGDGYADLAVSAPGEDLGTKVDAGMITVFYGSAIGLRFDNVATVSIADSGVLNASYSQAGRSLAAGDVGTNVVALGKSHGADGYDDLALGESQAGYALVALGGPGGLVPAQLIPNVGGLTSNVAVGDVNGDGQDEVVVGNPTASSDPDVSHGAVTIVDFGTGSDPGTITTIDKNTAGVPGTAAGYTTDMPDSFGAAIAVGDFNGDGRADVAVGAPGSPVTTSDKVKHEDAGTVTILYSDGTKIGTTGAIEVTQATAGVPGDPGKGDKLGTTLAAGDQNGDGIADLAMFSPGDRRLTVVPGAPAGLQFSASKAWTQGVNGVPDADEAGDLFGQSLRFESFSGLGPQGLAIGAPGENSGSGAVTVLYATASGLTGTHASWFNQDSPGVPGVAEGGDAFGAF